ncbi:hypothetical protein LEN26_019789 [Aphanomyces euteiches]|nr:hypothetical protein LEN26_019789 [Aphanomyces euteiches]KAH9128146.1 hypothetical protein AeMF1_001656 [Aphanomyces euteiches]KAH9191991.1 hypothetical protein AeNC1_006024 [Aphanomyces euteiches]
MVKCVFQECRSHVQVGSTKCRLHRNRSQCIEPNCPNQAYARGRCVRHGSRKHCQMDGCVHYRRSGGYCAKHTTAIRKGLIHPPTPLTDRCTANCKFEPLRFALDDAPPPIALLDVLDIAIIQSLLLDGGASDYADKATETKCEAKLSLLHELAAGATTTPSTVYFAV